MKRLTLVFSIVMALIGFNANAAIYIVGNDPFGNWNPGGGVEMTNNGDGTFSYSATINGTVYFVFADGLDSDWDVFNAEYRFGPTNGDTNVLPDTWVTTQKAGNTGSYYFTGSGEDYEITFDLNNMSFIIEGEVIPLDPNTGKLFILGQVNGNNWDPSTGIEMNLNDELTGDIFTLDDAIVNDSGDGYGYFSFTSKLGEDPDDWSFLPYRRGAVQEGVIVQNDTQTELGPWGTANSFKIIPGTYDFTVSIKDEGAYVKVIRKDVPVDEDVFILGEVNDNGGWFPNVGFQMTRDEENNIFTAVITTAGENDGYSYFSFTKKLAQNDSENGGWEEIAGYRFGATENDFEINEAVLGEPIQLIAQPNSFKIPAGQWNLTLSLASMTLVIEKVEGPAYPLGDVNHDLIVDVSDVTALIGYVLGNGDIYTDTANCDGAEGIDVGDVTALITLVLGN